MFINKQKWGIILVNNVSYIKYQNNIKYTLVEKYTNKMKYNQKAKIT